MKRLNSLDTLRSFAILIVLLGHSVLGYGSPAHLTPLQLGGIGVDLFFVLSGWLLGGQLFKEMASGHVDIKRFWYRRWYRTLPAYYAVLLFTVLQQLLTKDSIGNYWSYVFLLQNYTYPLDIFHVSWSLAVEEQFYLLIAPLVAGMLFLEKNQRLALLILLLFLPSVFRLLGWFEHYNETHVRIDGCVMGVLLALIRHQFNQAWQILIKASSVLFFFSLVLFVLFFLQRWYPNEYLSEPGFLTRAFMFACWVIYANKNAMTTSRLYFPGAHYIATRSYSMYLLHPDAIAIINRITINLDFTFYLLAVFLLTLFFAEILYKAIEIPFMKLRDRVLDPTKHALNAR
ncbi:acyltransferase [Paraglaciecola sp.]|uniref:acyltransferase family protein n=1 Tax=Paraglaciecola sp. TaxID=1920173 RepID=UPI00273E91C3|nr:acyltransferase [Paraglaciecola sp.]MDP5029567.1 acyltransferase [Paraglaciecola sp.]